MRKTIVTIFASVLLTGCVATAQSPVRISRHTRTPRYTFKTIREFPHDPNAFTQGLAYRDGFLYEGTGLERESSVRKVQLETGEILQRLDLPPEYFGEGITLFKGEIVQLTWQTGTAFVYDAKDFRLLKQFRYRGEGWGLATDGHELFLSDGTDTIRVLDPVTFKEKRSLKVHDGTTPIRQLNELEFVNGQIFANIWHTNQIARISRQSGSVVGWIDLEGLLSPVYQRDPEAVLNGIAYDAMTKRLFVTGKRWPKIFEINLLPKP